MNKKIPLVIKHDLVLNKRFIQNLILNKKHNHIARLLTVFNSNLLFNSDFVFHHYNLNIDYDLITREYPCYFLSDICKAVFKSNSVGYSHGEVLKRNEGFSYQLNQTFGCNGYSFYYDADNYDKIIYIQFDFLKNASEVDRKNSPYFYKIERPKPKNSQFTLSIDEFSNLLSFVLSTSMDEFEQLSINYDKEKAENNMQNLAKDLKKQVLIARTKQTFYFVFVFGLGYFTSYLINQF